MRNAAVMLIVKDNKILSVSRRYDSTKFGLPGGKAEEDETTEAAAIRETFEETGIKVTNCVHIYTRVELKDKPDGEDFYTYCYYATSWEGEPHKSEEGEVKWLTEEELTGESGAFRDYNKQTLLAFRQQFPKNALTF